MGALDPLLASLGPSVRWVEGQLTVLDPEALQTHIPALAEKAALAEGPEKGAAQYLIRATAQALGIIPSSIHDLYMARGRGEVPPSFTVPAINLRALPFLAARAVFRVMRELNAGPVIFEIARSEIGYTDQRPAEYAAQVLAAAIVEGHRGPVFIQGDHFQVSAKRYAKNPEAELQAVRDLIAEALKAGFFNIDIDTSTLVDLSQPTVQEQQRLNYTLTAQLTHYVRTLEPEGITVSTGGEIGEVGGHNSTPEELRAFMDGFNATLAEIAPNTPGLSKISIQTGTHHGGVVLPDGSLAKVKVDFDTLRLLSRIAREEYGLAGAVQHGASTLPEEAFSKFVEAEAAEVHLATNFMNILYKHMPDDLKAEIYAYLDQHHQHERKPDWTDEQFYYKTRKRALGPFKKQIWAMPTEVKARIYQDWEEQFRRLFRLLGLTNTRPLLDTYIHPVVVAPRLEDYVNLQAEAEDTRDLAD
ncbi:MAG: aldolase [Chloroflexi bacterium]|nr:aldolase [Chloroflexota bacterium]